MRVIVCAIFSEAKALIEFYGLKLTAKKPFNIFENDDIALIISNIGKINAAVATAYIAALKKPDKIINIGICASVGKNRQIGSLYKIRSVIETSSGKKAVVSNEGEVLYCFDKPVENKNKPKENILIDMESYGFYAAASKFVKKENIKIYKIISDYLEISHIDSKFVYTLMKNNLTKFEEIV